MKDNTLLYVGGAGLLAYLYFSGTTTPAATTVPGAPAPPTSFNQSYYDTYQYPAMLKANPEIGNPNHVLTQAEANQYLANYLELQQWLPTQVPKPWPNSLTALQQHWQHFAVPLRYSFMPFTPPKNVNWTPPPANANTNSSSSSWELTALKIAGSVVALLGVDPVLNDKEAEILITGSAIGMDMIPFFYNERDGLAELIEEKNIALLRKYTA